MQLLDVPVIDIAPFLRGAPADKARVAEQVGRACRDIGFLVIQGHGIHPVLMRHDDMTPCPAESFIEGAAYCPQLPGGWSPVRRLNIQFLTSFQLSAMTPSWSAPS